MRILLVLALLVATPAAAQRLDTVRAAAGDDLRVLVSAREAAERGHLTRLAVWGGLSIASGAALALASPRRRHPSRWAFGVQTAGWGAVNAAIAAYGLTREPSPATTVAEALRRENGYHDILLFNEGLNVAYVATGATMALAAREGVRGADAWRGHGLAIVVQGAALLALDGVALAGSSDRHDALTRIAVEARPGGAAMTVRW